MSIIGFIRYLLKSRAERLRWIERENARTKAAVA
jgi:hypothetical protein